MPNGKHTPGPWIMKLGDPETREYWSIEAPNSPHPIGPAYTRSDNVVGTCCSAGVYREEDARLICGIPELIELIRHDHLWESTGARVSGHEECKVCEWLEKHTNLGGSNVR